MAARAYSLQEGALTVRDWVSLKHIRGFSFFNGHCLTDDFISQYLNKVLYVPKSKLILGSQCCFHKQEDIVV